MKINQRALETSLKMTSKAGIIAFTTFGVVVFLLVFLGMVFTTPKTIPAWKIVFGAVVLYFGRYLLIKLVEKNTDTTIR